jgi:hypothetical protein
MKTIYSIKGLSFIGGLCFSYIFGVKILPVIKELAKIQLFLSV